MRIRSNSTWPTGHGGWFYSEPAAFEGGAGSFLAEGVRRNERILFIAEDPGVRRWPKHLVDNGVLVLGTVEETYWPLRAGDLDAQRALFERAIAEAQLDGFAGIRVVADSTRLVLEDLERWVEWESIADALMSASPVTGLCAFDRSRCAPEDLRTMVQLHPRVVEAI